jgi:LuxR family maltose regulon positive regulatory protein
MHALRGAILLGLGIGYFGLGRADPARQALQAALPYNQQAGNRYAALSCIYYLVRNHAMCGRLNRAISEGEKGLQWIAEWSKPEGGQRPPARLWAHLRREMGIVQYERNDLGSAAENLGQATEYYELVGSLHRVTGYAFLVDVGQALGHAGAALGYMARLKQARVTPGLSLPDIPLAAMVVERGLLLYRMAPGLSHFLSEAVEWAETCGLEPSDPLPHEREYEYLTLARVRIAQGRAEEVIPLLERLIASAGGAGRSGELIAYLSLQAAAQRAVGDSDAALCSLARALALGEPEGYVRSFVDHGAPMVDLLKRRRASPAVSGPPSAVDQAYIDRLLAAFGATAKDREPAEPSSLGRPSSSVGRPSSPLIEPLNDRETQILRLLAVRRSYREIAEELYLSLNTVKWYIQNIYGKLGVNRRDRAIARAQRLGIL